MMLSRLELLSSLFLSSLLVGITKRFTRQRGTGLHCLLLNFLHFKNLRSGAEQRRCGCESEAESCGRS